MDNYKKFKHGYPMKYKWKYKSSSKHSHKHCNCDNPNCQGNCRCNCKGHTHDTSSSSSSSSSTSSTSSKSSSSSSTSNSMCGSVFGPICEPEVCDIPRFPHTQDLVVGNGTICGDQECSCEEVPDETSLEEEITQRSETNRCIDDSDRCENGCQDEETDCTKQYRFTIHIRREFTTHLGEFALYDGLGKLIVRSEKLECYHSPTKDTMVAIFHVALDNGTSREVTIYAKNKICESPAALYVYSAPLFDAEIRVGSELLQGELNIFSDKVSQEH